jgi:eukaryotic-like serine/threonine-protein kinase
VKPVDDNTPTVPAGSDGLAGSIKDIAPGALYGRYMILERVGAGGMGVVYKAFDPHLDRKVALKLVRVGKAGSDASEGRERLLREAQAIAKLSHPNVVAVFDVGSLAGEVYVAMEYVDGESLAAWLRAGPRDEDEVLDVYLQAGRGLAAAHRAGVVHRDFKPENVLVGHDGRVRVVDFGLAQAPERLPVGDEESTAVRAELHDDGEPLTETGAVLGTPAFMSPEQHLGRATDPATDQFSFCVALFEALYGEHPFSAGGVKELAQAVVAGVVREPPRAARVPRAIRKALVRGMSASPSARWP